MQTSKFSVTLMLIAFVGHCTSAKLPKTAAKDLKPSHLKHNHEHSAKNTINEHLKQPSGLLATKKKTKDSNDLKSKKTWSTAKSVIVQPLQRDGVVRTQVSTNPLLDQLYVQRYHALEEVDRINNRINFILQRNAQRNNYANAVSSFMNPASTSSDSYAVKGGSVVLGPANAGSVAGVENAQLRQLAVKMAKHHHVKSDNAPLDMPKPMDDAEDTSAKPAPKSDKESADVEDEADLGDPRKFDSVCSVLKLTFEHTNGATILDDSPKTNNAQLDDGAYVANTGSTSGIAATIGDDGYVEIPGTFNGKPKKAAAISMWVKLRSVDGKNPLFQASDRNGTTHYDLSVVNGRATWIHRDDTDQEIFKVKASDDSLFTVGKWHHIVGTYSSKHKKATLWLDGKEVGHQKNVKGLLSQDWSKAFVFEGKTVGFADNIFMFRCPLDRTKVVALYVSSSSPKHEKKSSIPKP